MLILHYLYLLIILLIFLIAIFLLFKKRGRLRISKSLDMVLFLVRLPRYEKKEGKPDIKSLIGKVEQFYSNFLYLKKPNIFQRFFYGLPRVALEIASEVGGTDICFYVAVPRYLEKGFEKYVQGIYPGALVEKKPEDYTIFEPEGQVAASFLRLKKSIYFPINTYKNLETDPLEIITNSLSKIYPQEGAAIQLILRQTSFNLKERGEKIISLIKEGKSPQLAIAEVQKSSFLKFLRFLIESLFLEKRAKKEMEKIKEKEVVDEAAIEAILTKIQKPILEANVRLVAVAKEKWRAEEILHYLEDSFSQFMGSYNGFETIKVKKRALNSFIYDFSFRNFAKKRKILLNLEELSSIYHFPLFYFEAPYIKWVKTKEVAPPAELPSFGLNLIGKAIFRGEEKEVFFASKEDRRRHFYLVGQTGTGKTSLLREMIRQDIERGEGVGVIDPHGDLILDTLANIPKERIEDVVLFEPFDLERPCGLNMLEYETPEQKDFAVSEMIVIFSKLFPPEVIGPMFEHYMRNAMLALMADKENPGTLVEIPRIFVDEEFMRERLKKVTDPLVRNFWEKEWAQTTGATRSDMLGYVISKVGRFVENEMMRNIIGQSHSSFDLAKIMDEGKIFLANLSKGQTGEINSSLLGLILVSKLQMAAMKRGQIPLEKRKDFYLYIDEFQNFTTDSIATILSEARKYRLNLILAHQFIPQLTEEIKNAVMGNVGTLAAFRVGPIDAEFLERQFEPEFSKFDLVNLDNFEIIIKMMINNKISSPFKIKINYPKAGNLEIAELTRKLSKLKYGREKREVEKEITERAKLAQL